MFRLQLQQREIPTSRVSRNETVTINFSRCGHLFSQIERLLLSARQEEARNLGVVGIHSEVGEKKRFSARFIASAVRFQGYEYSVNLCEGLGILRLQNPAFLGSIVFVEDA
jgi:hypothetical protein